MNRENAVVLPRNIQAEGQLTTRRLDHCPPKAGLDVGGDTIFPLVVLATRQQQNEQFEKRQGLLHGGKRKVV